MSPNSRDRSAERMRVADEMSGGRGSQREVFEQEGERRKARDSRPKTTPRFRADIRFSFCKAITLERRRNREVSLRPSGVGKKTGNEPIEMKHEIPKGVEVSFGKLSNERKESCSFGVQVTNHWR